MTGDRDTIAFYDGNADDYASFAAESAEHPKLEAFIALMPPEAKVLDLGCGIGWAAAAFRDAGFRIDAMDASAGLVAKARELYGIEARRAAFRTLSARSRYDGIWCHFALQHAERPERPQIFERIHTALRPGGLVYIGVQKGPMDWRDDFGRLYCPFRDEDMAALLDDAGLTDHRFEYGTGKNYDGTPTLGLYVWARKNA